MNSQKWAFTFGTDHLDANGHSLGNSYVVIAGSFNETRQKIHELRGSKWSFQYTLEEIEEQAFRYGLQEVSLNSIAL